MKHIFLILVSIFCALCVNAQNSLPAPGGSAGGNSLPAPGGNSAGPAFMPPAGPNWGSPWGPPPPASNPAWVPTYYGTGWQNGGNLTVLGCGYDAQGVWRIVPMRVNYDYNGIQYDVEVINAWNPWTDTWNYGVDVPAVNTSYYLRGNTYDFYAVLSTGTYYFNL
ncbi:MAG: hypothetical protein NC402_01845 [Prevotella sp.]|nr:hypothetical protein [Prevotella sp.]MCM1074265.1 hypothetical protein [Ruminococcus sp.]